HKTIDSHYPKIAFRDGDHVAEGIASVGLRWAPVAAFFCGLLLSLGNSLSRHLPASLIAASAGLSIQALLNVPLSTSLLTHGLMVLFLLWYICPDIKTPVRSPL